MGAGLPELRLGKSGTFRYGAGKTRGSPLMKHRTASGAVTARALSRVAMAALALTAEEGALAQQRSTKTPAPPSQGPPGPTAGQAEPGKRPTTVAAKNGQQQLPVIASPWTRYCVKNPAAQSAEGGTKEVCFTASDGRSEIGAEGRYRAAYRVEGELIQSFCASRCRSACASPGRAHRHRRARRDDCALCCLPAPKWLHGGL